MKNNLYCQSKNIHFQLFCLISADATSDNESIAGDEHPQHHANGGWGSVAGLQDNHNQDAISIKGIATPVTETNLTANHNSLGRNDDCWSRAGSAANSRPSSVASDYVGSMGRKHWVDVITGISDKFYFMSSK